jgi:hypothetical protein
MNNLNSSTSDYTSIGNNFTPIGNYDETQFSGTLDGEFHTISGLTINEDRDYVGLFGYLWQANIKNLIILGADIDGYDQTGALAGGVQESNISNVIVDMSSVDGSLYVGGVVGKLYDSNIDKCASTGNAIAGEESVGGISGSWQSASTISKSYSTSSITATYQNAGGIVGGENTVGGNTVSNCWSSGFVTTYYTGAGGIISDLTQGSTLTNCWSSATVSADSYIGGLVGFQDASYLYNSFFVGSASAMGDFVGGVIGQELLPVESLNNSWLTSSFTYAVGGNMGEPPEVAPEATLGARGTDQTDITYFYNSSNSFFDTWDFVNVWNTKEDNSVYPFFRWEDNADYFFAPVVYLFLVENQENRNMTFAYNISDDSEIKNCSLYVDRVKVNDNETTINKLTNNSINGTNISVGAHNASIYCYDIYNKGNTSVNVTFNITNVNPVVYLFPIENPTSLSRTFIYNVSDDSNISSCASYMTGFSAVSNTTTVNKSANNSFTASGLDYSTTYSVYISCEDEWGNIGNSSNVTFSVGAEPIEETTTSSSSSGVVYNVDGETIKGVFPKNSDVSIKINGTIHKLKVLNLTNSSVFFVLRSEPQNVSLNLGESKIVKVDSMNLNITLTKILGNVAYMNISKVVVKDVSEGEIEVEIETGDNEDIGDNGSDLVYSFDWKKWGVILLIIVLVVIVLILATKHHKVKKKRKSLA